MRDESAGATNRIRFLKGWLNEPYAQDPVIAVLEAAEWPMTLREVAEEAKVPLRSANRVLYRLHKKGRVTRYRLPMQRHAYCRKRRECIPYAAKRMLYVYKWRETPEREMRSVIARR
jgi:predicted transcriptional regulator